MMVHIGLSLLGCAVETLGIELPPGGADAISQEDLRRDARLFAGPDAPARYAERMAQMRFTPEGPCAVRGAGPPLRLTLPDEPVQRAVLVSLAKGWDTLDGPTGRVELCVGDAAPVDVVRLPTGDVDWRALERATRARFRTATQPASGPPQ